MNPYVRFALMIATSIVFMYLLTYVNSYQIIGHAHFSETRVFMALIMGACMAVIMLTFMLGMHKNRVLNVAIYVASTAIFAVSLWLVRSQVTVDDVDYMEAMIPHHSIAILTSERAQIGDARVRKLADEIIAAQRREIAEMEVLIDDIRKNGTQEAPHRETATQMLLGPEVPPPDASEVEVPEGFRVEVVVSGLTYPTSVEFGDSGEMYIAEAGYSYGDDLPAPRILRISPEGDPAGPRRLLDVRFAPDGNALYVADFGSMAVGDKPRPVPGTGVIWRIVPENSPPAVPPAGLSSDE
ncbi:MAG: DUF305 domain-containing protein [Phycisphaerales bacterium]|nr:DUF305 domain-containing protein [Phycisphaerales bacterium]